MIIWKYPFPITDSFILEMPRYAALLDAQVQHGVPCLWALVDPKWPTVQRAFTIIGTGHPIEGINWTQHVATFQQGPFVWHLFDQGEVKP